MGVHYGTMGDVIDYGELISGVRCDGFLASFTSLAMKCGGASARRPAVRSPRR